MQHLFGGSSEVFFLFLFFFLVTTVFKEQPSDDAPCFQKLNNSGRGRESQQGADGGNFEVCCAAAAKYVANPQGESWVAGGLK